MNCIVQNQNEQAEALKVDPSERHFGENFPLYHYQHSKIFIQIWVSDFRVPHGRELK